MFSINQQFLQIFLPCKYCVFLNLLLFLLYHYPPGVFFGVFFFEIIYFDVYLSGFKIMLPMGFYVQNPSRAIDLLGFCKILFNIYLC